MEIDRDGVMWVIDVGRRNIFDEPPDVIDNTCPPKVASGLPMPDTSELGPLFAERS
jgi:hypothetical protein